MRLHNLGNKKPERPDRAQMARLRRFGYVEQPGSGCGRWKKSDAINEVHQLEGKATDSKSQTVTAKVLAKLIRECESTGKVPAFLFSMKGSDDWIAVRADFYAEVLEAWLKRH